MLILKNQRNTYKKQNTNPGNKAFISKRYMNAQYLIIRSQEKYVQLE